MPVFEYVARDQDGAANRGSVSAASEEEARKQLRHRGLFVTELRPEGGGGIFARIARLFHGQDDISKSRP